MDIEKNHNQIDRDTLLQSDIARIFRGHVFLKGSKETANDFANELNHTYEQDSTTSHTIIRAAALPNPVFGGYKIIVPLGNDEKTALAISKAIENMGDKIQQRIDSTTIRIDGGGAWTGQTNYTVFEL